MRILQITPGTGNFHCGSCLRDNAVVRRLRADGHDVLMLPLYLPFVLDEPDQAAGQPLFFGGINVYLQQLSALFRHLPRWLDPLLNAPSLLRHAARRAGMTRPSDLGEMTLSMLRGEHGLQARELDKLLSHLRAQPPFDLVSISNALLLGMAPRLRRDLGSAVVCTLQGEDTFLDALDPPHRDQAWALLRQCCDHVDAFIPVSHYYGSRMAQRLAISAQRLHVVHNGIDLDGYPAGPAPASDHAPPTIGYLARLCPTKGLDTLIDAFLLLHQHGTVPNARLRLAGTCTPSDQPFIQRAKARIDAAGAAARIDWLPNLNREDKIDFLRSLHVFSVPATYGEAFGLYVIEALAAGVPVVQPRHAAFPELITATAGGILCQPDDPRDLADQLASLLLDPPRARAMGQAGQAVVIAQFSSQRMASQVLGVFEHALKLRHG